jgi:hypothetical protein
LPTLPCAVCGSRQDCYPNSGIRHASARRRRKPGSSESYPLILAPVFTDVPFEAGTDLDDGPVAETIHGMRMVFPPTP